MRQGISKITLILMMAMILMVSGQFGVKKETPKDAASEVQSGSGDDLTSLTEQDAIDIRAVIEAAGEDPETIKLVAALKDENAEELDELRKMPIEEIMHELKVTLDEMKMLDFLFQDPLKALEIMEAENLIPSDHLPQYKENPALLEEDTRKALYFRFVSLSVVAGYL